jgi:hypothetical protein
MVSIDIIVRGSRSMAPKKKCAGGGKTTVKRKQALSEVNEDNVKKARLQADDVSGCKQFHFRLVVEHW